MKKFNFFYPFLVTLIALVTLTFSTREQLFSIGKGKNSTECQDSVKLLKRHIRMYDDLIEDQQEEIMELTLKMEQDTTLRN